MSDLNKLPSDWKFIPLNDAVEVVLGQSPKSSTYNDSSEGLPFFQGKTEFGAIYPTVRKWCTEPKKTAEKDDVLVSVRAPVGPTNLAPSKCAIGRGLAALRPLNGEDAKYFLYLIRRYQQDLAALGTGTTFEAISGTTLKSFMVPVPPPEQQKQIVAKIEQLFSHIDAGIEALNTAKQRLKQYRQSVLKAAVTGELTKEWREANESKLEPVSQLLERILQTRRQKWEELQLEQFKTKGKVPKNDKWKEKYKAPKVPVMHMDLESPEEWEVASVDQVAEVFLGKMLDKSKHTTGERLPYLRNINVRWGRIDTNDLLEMFFKESELKRFKVIAGDVLVCEGGEPGRAAVWKETNTTIKYQKALHRVRFYLPILPQYLVYLLEYFASTGLLAKYFTGSTIKHFTKEAFITLPFPLPSLIEMQQIISVVDEKMYSIRRLENEINTQLLKAQKTKQSILASAFVGKLTVTPKGAEI